MTETARAAKLREVFMRCGLHPTPIVYYIDVSSWTCTWPNLTPSDTHLTREVRPECVGHHRGLRAAGYNPSAFPLEHSHLKCHIYCSHFMLMSAPTCRS